MPNWTDVIDRWAARKTNPRRSDQIAWEATRSSSMHGYSVVRATADPHVLKSYGHWPMAYYLGEKDGRHLFLKNGDKNSPTTNQQLAHMQTRCEGPTVSFSALESADLHPCDIKLAQIVDWRKDSRTHIWRDRRTGKMYKDYSYKQNKGQDEFPQPDQGMFIKYDDYNADFEKGVWHVLGAVLLHINNNWYLCSLDEGSYFISKLPSAAHNIDDSFNLLKPQAVKDAEGQGREVVRQGEWFFIPTDLDDQRMAEKMEWSKTKLHATAKTKELPRDHRFSNRHVVKHFVAPDGKTYCKGRVFHRDSDYNRLTGQHKTINLGDKWYEAHHNTELESWTQGGNFD